MGHREVRLTAHAQDHFWAMWCHLAAIAGLLGIPFGHILGPLVVWGFKRDLGSFVDDQGKEALNFQLSITLYLLAAEFLAGLLSFSFFGNEWGVVFVPFMVGSLAIGIMVLLLEGFVIAAAVKCRQGEAFRYPATIQFFSGPSRAP